ncbi:MAG: hypothetical protein K9N55_17520 [Phycisphaerae bacterium]|nr:hypothetical protein [Phycisphaerae bacterium]
MNEKAARQDAGSKAGNPKRPCGSEQRLCIDMLLGLAGAIAGAVLGYFLVFVIARQGFYAIALPGALLGLGCGALSGRKSVAMGIMCGVLGFAVGIYTQWRFAPFVKDESLSFYLAHLLDVNRVTQILILMGAMLAFWFGMGREGGAWIRRKIQNG